MCSKPQMTHCLRQSGQMLTQCKGCIIVFSSLGGGGGGGGGGLGWGDGLWYEGDGDVHQKICMESLWGPIWVWHMCVFKLVKDTIFMTDQVQP